jgi:uncharacterized OsmC-like protein
MKISSLIKSELNKHSTFVQTNDTKQEIHISPKATGYGSSVNGGELLMLALATCFCNDLYREAKKRNITVSNIEVNVTGEFGAEGEPGTNFQYTASVIADAPQSIIDELIAHTDTVAEIQNTLRKGILIPMTK